MAHEPVNDDPLSRVDPERREFLKKVVAGTAFTVPLMASFSMEGLSLNTAEASCAYIPYSYCSDTPYDGPLSFTVPLFVFDAHQRKQKRVGTFNAHVVDHGCSLEFQLQRKGGGLFRICYGSLSQLFDLGNMSFESVVGLGDSIQDRLGHALGALSQSAGGGAGSLGDVAARLQTALSDSVSSCSQLAIPFAFLISAGGVLILTHSGRVCSGPGFDLTCLLEAMAAGEFVIIVVIAEGLVVGAPIV